MRELILAGSLLFVSACNPKPVPPDPNGTSAPPAGAVSSEDADRKEIEKLEAEAKALASVASISTRSFHFSLRISSQASPRYPRA